MNLDLQFEPVKKWEMNFSKNIPEVICISRPFIEQILFMGQYDKNLTFYSSMYSDHHHSHNARIIDIDIFNGKRKLLEENPYFNLKKSLKYRKENNGSLVVQGHNTYFVNDIGLELSKSFSKPFLYQDLNRFSSNLNIPLKESEKFFKNFLIFDLLEWTR